MLEGLTAASFEPHIGTEFAISLDGEDEVLTLTAVTPGKAHPGYEREPFALSFNGARTDALFPSRTVDMRHETMGAIAFMITPTGRNEDGTFRYEAIFG